MNPKCRLSLFCIVIFWIFSPPAFAGGDSRYERDLADQLLKTWPIPDYYGQPGTLDIWLAAGKLTPACARRQSPGALIKKLEARHIYTCGGCIAHEFWAYRQLSYVYSDSLRILNRTSHDEAEKRAALYRQGLSAVVEFLDDTVMERNYRHDMVWGQAEWLLYSSPPSYFAPNGGTGTGQTDGQKISLSHFMECLRDFSHNHGQAIIDRELDPLLKNVEDPLKAILPRFSPQGRDFLFGELLAILRDRSDYFYRGADLG